MSEQGHVITTPDSSQADPSQATSTTDGSLPTAGGGGHEAADQRLMVDASPAEESVGERTDPVSAKDIIEQREQAVADLEEALSNREAELTAAIERLMAQRDNVRASRAILQPLRAEMLELQHKLELFGEAVNLTRQRGIVQLEQMGIAQTVDTFFGDGADGMGAMRALNLTDEADPRQVVAVGSEALCRVHEFGLGFDICWPAFAQAVEQGIEPVANTLLGLIRELKSPPAEGYDQLDLLQEVVQEHRRNLAAKREVEEVVLARAADLALPSVDEVLSSPVLGDA